MPVAEKVARGALQSKRTAARREKRNQCSERWANERGSGAETTERENNRKKAEDHKKVERFIIAPRDMLQAATRCRAIASKKTRQVLGSAAKRWDWKKRLSTESCLEPAECLTSICEDQDTVVATDPEDELQDDLAKV